MNNLITAVVGFIKELIKPISVAIGSFLLYRQGKQAVEKKTAETHVKDAQDAQTLNDYINSLPDDGLDKLLNGSGTNGENEKTKGKQQ